MKMKHINKILTSVLSVSMLMGGALPVQAADGGVDVDAPIYSLDILNVVVPTSYAVAFNPDGLTVKTGDSSNSTAQILSKNFGIINKSSKDKVITITLNVADQNTGSGITFVDSAQDVTDAADGEYKIHLTAIPADTAEVQVGSASATQTTDAAALNDVTMTGATGNAVTLKGGENYIGFMLQKANWTPKGDNELTLGGTNSNDVSANYEITGLAGSGKGITAFTFGGEMSTKADWSKLTKGIKITVIYDTENATSGLTAISGTGAMVEVNVAPTFATGKGIGQIKYSRGAGDDGVKEIKKVEVTNLTNGQVFDGYHALNNLWGDATDESGVITLTSEFLAFFDPEAPEATVTYVTNGGETKTAIVNVWRVAPPVEAPDFTTGSGVGQINYTMGTGDDGLKAITKIEVTNPTNSQVFDGYHEYSGLWSDATDANGVITFDSRFITFFTEWPTIEAKVTYETNSGETRTATVDIKTQ